MHAPTTELLKEIYEGLKVFDVPVYTRLPSETVLEPFFVIGEHRDEDMSAKMNLAVTRTELKIDLFYPYRDRAEIEDFTHNVKSVLSQKRKTVTSNIIYDDSIGRKVFHVVFYVNTII